MAKLPVVRTETGRITEDARLYFYDRVRAGENPYQVGKRLEVSRPTVRRWMKNAQGFYKDGHKMTPMEVADSLAERKPSTRRGEADLSEFPDPITRYMDLDKKARQAYKEFGYWRQRYLHRRNIPWQIEMAQILMAWLEEAREKEERVRGILNTPPGGGKTTTVTHDFPGWLMSRDRNIRISLGSRTTGQSERYVRRLRTTVEKNALLNLEFGRFKPLEPETWRKDQFTIDGATGSTASMDYKLALAGFDHEDPVVQARLEDEDDEIWEIIDAMEAVFVAGEKEPTVSALSQEMGFLGGRYDINLWDDLVDRSNSRTPEQRESLAEWWHAEAESRCEPGGVVGLIGTRFGKYDLFRHCRDLTFTSDDEVEAEILNASMGSMSDAELNAIREDLEREMVDKHGYRMDDLASFDGPDAATMRRRATRVYRYVKFPAHDTNKCPNPASNSAKVHTECLLDPKRFRWYDLMRARASDPRKYALTYQQEDESTSENLIQEVWLTGGVDEDGVSVPGCYNYDRKLLEIPTHLNPEHCFSIATVDPSPQNWWSVQWWIWDAKEDKDYLINLLRARLTSGGFIDFDTRKEEYMGVMHQWQTASAIAGWPIGLWIIEQAAAQRFLFQYNWVNRWMSDMRTNIKGHETQRNKSDSDFGVETLKSRYRLGLTDIPYSPDDMRTRVTINEFKQELTEWPDAATEDMVMGHWFLHWNRYKIPKSLTVAKARQGGLQHPYSDTMQGNIHESRRSPEVDERSSRRARRSSRRRRA